MPDDLDMLRELGFALDPPHRAAAPDRLHVRVMEAIAAEDAAGSPYASARQHRAGGRGRLTLPRLSRRLTLTAGVSVALAAALLVLPTTHRGQGAPPAGSPKGAAPAQEILTDAANAAMDTPALTPQPDQFVYVKSIEYLQQDSGGQGPAAGPTATFQFWGSVDGSRAGWLDKDDLHNSGNSVDSPTPGCDGNGDWVGPPSVIDGGVSGPCRPDPAYLDTLPTTTAGMSAYLLDGLSGGGSGSPVASPGPDAPAASVSTAPSTTQGAFNEAGTLLDDHYLPPASLAALFNALAEMDGVGVTHDVQDAAGQPGDAVGATVGGGEGVQLIFDQKTHQFLGERDVNMVAVQAASPGTGVLPAGTVTFETAVLQIAIVDQAGQQP